MSAKSPEPQPSPAAERAGPSATTRPRRVALAAMVTGAQGAVIVALGVIMLILLVVGEPDGALQAGTGAVTVLALAVLPLAAGHGLWRLRRWSRGPAVVVQILALPTSWHMFQVGGGWAVAAAPLAVSAIVVLGALSGQSVAEALGVVPSRTSEEPPADEHGEGPEPAASSGRK